MIIIDLPWHKPPLNLNQRMHWAEKARITREIRETVAILAARKPLPTPALVTLLWTVSDARRRDTDNPAPTVKACIDGIRDAGVWPDDHSGIVVGSGTRIIRGEVPRLQLVIEAA